MNAPLRATSRIVRKERKKVVKQTFYLVLVTIAIILGFIFVIIPGFIRIVNTFLDSSNPFSESDTLPPQIPIVSTPPQGINTPDVTIEGFGEPKSTVFVLLNGERTEGVVVGDDGVFKKDVTLTEGENSIAAFGVDASENESLVSQRFTTVLDTEMPTFVLDDVANGKEYVSRANQSLQLKGRTEPKAKVFINERLVIPDSEGSFQTTMQLQEGENKIKVKIEDIGGNVYEEEITVKFRL